MAKNSERLGIQNRIRLAVHFGTKFKGKLGFQNQSIWQTKLMKTGIILKTLAAVKKPIGYHSKGKQSCNIVLDIDGETCFDPKRVANCFLIHVSQILPLPWLVSSVRFAK